MPRITSQGPSNNPLERWEALRLGTNFLTPVSGPDKNGISGTTDPQSPVPDAESPSSMVLPQRRLFSTAALTDGSGQGTSSSQVSQSGSLEDSALPKEVTPDPAPAADPYSGISGSEAMELARQSFFNRDYEESERLLAISENLGEDPTAIAMARGYVKEARLAAQAGSGPWQGASSGPSEEDPSAGGTLVP